MIDQKFIVDRRKTFRRHNLLILLVALLLALAVNLACAEDFKITNPTDFAAVSKIKVAHWKVVTTRYFDNEKVTFTTENWVKDGRWRQESPGITRIDTDTKSWRYNQDTNHYKLTIMSKPSVYGMLNFWPNYVAYCEQFCRGEVSNTTTSYKGNEYKAFNIDIAAIDNVGCRNIVVIIDPDSGLIKAKITKQYKADGSLWYEEEAEYDYNKLDLSDDFFVFQPPEGAIEDPNMGMKR